MSLLRGHAKRKPKKAAWAVVVRTDTNNDDLAADVLGEVQDAVATHDNVTAVFLVRVTEVPQAPDGG